VSALGLFPTIHALVGSKEKNKMAASSGDVNSVSVADIIKRADELYRQNAVDELYEHMKQHSSSTDADVLWRLARATCDKAKSTTDKNTRKELMYDAFRAAEQALKFGDSNFACHKWYAIMLDYVGEYEGTKERIAKAFKIKEHFLRAIQLNPRDATSVHLLGYWCFVFADMPWYQKKVASVVFATPPSSTYQEALGHFLEAEKIDPGFYSSNLLMIGKTYLRMKENELAKQFLIKARDYPAQTEDDKKAHKESVELLQSLGVK
jgi:tetratricopeptide (TPR) repeat protein